MMDERAHLALNAAREQREMLVYAAAVIGPSVCALLAAIPRKRRGVARPETPPPPARVRPLGFASLLLACVGIYFFIYSPKIAGVIDLFHEGEQLVPMMVGLSGGLPYRDVWIQHGLFKNYLLPLAAAELFGPTLAGLRSFFALLEPLGYLALFFAASRFYRRPLVTPLLLVLTVSGAGHWVSFRPSLALLSLGLLLGELRSERARAGGIAASGAAAGGAIWLSLDFGLYCTVGSIAALVLTAADDARTGMRGRESCRMLGWFAVGWCAAALSVLLALFVLGAGTAAIANIRMQLADQAAVWGLPAPLPGMQREALLFYLVPAVYGAAASALALRWPRGRLSGEERAVLLVLLQAILYYRTALGRSDFGHWIDAVPLFWMLLLLPVDALLLRPSIRRAAFALPIVVFVEAITAPIESAAARLASKPRVYAEPSARPKSDEIGPVRVDGAQARLLLEVVQRVRQLSSPADCIFDFSNQGAYYFFAGRRPASRFFNPIYAASSEAEDELLSALESCNPQVVIYRTGSVFDAVDAVPQPVRSPRIEQFLRRNYRVDSIVASTEIWSRRNITPEPDADENAHESSGANRRLSSS